MVLGPDDLIGQFILSQLPSNLPESWPRRSIGAWHLGTHPALPVRQIIASDSTVIGWLLGYPINAQARLVMEDIRFPVTPGIADISDQFESFLYAYGGRFAAVLLTPQASRFYLDPCGSLAAVFSSARQIVASTASLIPYPPEDDDNHELIKAMEKPQEDSYYPFGLTPRRSVERLLPSHFLDLQTWLVIRHWPRGEIFPAKNVREVVRELADLLKNNISAIACHYPLHLAMTAGRDSRMLLACSREHIDNIILYTVSTPNAGGRLDCHLAPKIAARFGLKHVLLRYEVADEGQIKQWEYRTGNCVHGLIMNWNPSFKGLDPRRAVLLGAAGELGRGFHWRRGDTESSSVSAADLLIKSQMPQTPQTLARAQWWLDGLPVRNALTIWGLLYNETFNGCWFGPVNYGLVSNALYIWPLCQRRIIEIMLSLPLEYRRCHRLPEELVEDEWPKLLSLPFNWFVGIRRYLYAVAWRARSLRGKMAALVKF